MAKTKDKVKKKTPKIYDPPFVNYDIVKFEVPRNGEPRLQLQEYGTGRLFEARLAIWRSERTNELSVYPVRHYTDPESQGWFPDSECWPRELLERDEGE